VLIARLNINGSASKVEWMKLLILSIIGLLISASRGYEEPSNPDTPPACISDFDPEVSVNGVFLDDDVSVLRSFGDVNGRLNHDETLPSWAVLNNDRTQELTLIFFPGHVKNRFHQFQIAYAGRDSKLTSCKVQDFITNSGIKLGMTKDDVIGKKGSSFQGTDQDTYITYIIDNIQNSDFLKQYNMPYYFARYEFDEFNRLTKIVFGFEYP
jgi:hypothetical protein